MRTKEKKKKEFKSNCDERITLFCLVTRNILEGVRVSVCVCVCVCSENMLSSLYINLF